MSSVVLITGCSSGLGRALALHLHQQRNGAGAMQPYRVFASARKLSSLKDLEAAGLDIVQLDVTDQSSVDAAVKQVVQKAGRIDVLVNNAGLSRVGPIVEQPLGEVEEIFAANFFGVLRVTQAVAPVMMRQRRGLIVNIGSVVTTLSTPFGGAYSASKSALQSVTDSLRLEVEPYGVKVTYVVAGSIRSSFGDNILSGMDVARYERPDSLYRPLGQKIRERAMMSQDPKSSKSAEATAAQIAAVISRALSPPAAWRRWLPVWLAQSPPTWFLVGGDAAMLYTLGLLQKLLGWPTNGMLSKRFGLDKPLA